MDTGGKALLAVMGDHARQRQAGKPMYSHWLHIARRISPELERRIKSFHPRTSRDGYGGSRTLGAGNAARRGEGGESQVISTHCGVRLVQTLPHIIGSRVGKHEWRCLGCGRKFTQRTRRPTKGK